MLIIQNQNDTMGNLIQSNLINYYGFGSDNELLKYCEEAIIAREYSKFIFTKSLSQIILFYLIF